MNDSFRPYAIAQVYAGLGDREAVWEWLDRAYEARDVHLVFMPVDSRWDEFRSNPAYNELLKRCGFVSK